MIAPFDVGYGPNVSDFTPLTPVVMVSDGVVPRGGYTVISFTLEFET
jgi:hypothetical protein